MKRFCTVIATLIVLSGVLHGKDTPEQIAEQDRFRATIPLGGNFAPKPEEGVFVAAGHSMNVVTSRDDGKTWQRTFYGHPCGDHGRWAVWNSVAYTKGVFAIAAGWGAPGTILASEDGQNWRHLTAGSRKPTKSDQQPYDMLNTMQFIGVDGAFILPMESTSDFGKTWQRMSRYGFRDEAGERVKVDLSHPSIACGDFNGSKRILVVGDQGPAVFSDNLGQTWTPMNVEIEPWEERGAKAVIAMGSVFVIVKGSGDTALRSTDGGMTWKSYPLGVRRPASRSFGISRVGDEIWMTGENAKASKDGMTWRDLPKDTPSGRIAISDKGTLISVNRKRHSILRSEDNGMTWQEVYSFEPDPNASGGQQGFADVEFGLVNKVNSSAK